MRNRCSTGDTSLRPAAEPGEDRNAEPEYRITQIRVLRPAAEPGEDRNWLPPAIGLCALGEAAPGRRAGRGSQRLISLSVRSRQHSCARPPSRARIATCFTPPMIRACVSGCARPPSRARIATGSSARSRASCASLRPAAEPGEDRNTLAKPVSAPKTRRAAPGRRAGRGSQRQPVQHGHHHERDGCARPPSRARIATPSRRSPQNRWRTAAPGRRAGRGSQRRIEVSGRHRPDRVLRPAAEPGEDRNHCHPLCQG